MHARPGPVHAAHPNAPTWTPSAMTRMPGLDVLRGLMLVLMTVTHLPISIGGAFGQPFGYVSAAEGFVLLSGFIAGLVFTRRLDRHGPAAVRSALQKRALQIYLCHVALLMFLFTIVASLGVALERAAVTNLLGFFLDQPIQALFGGLLLLYRPPLLDILPMYAAFLLVTPALLAFGARGGWPKLLGLSGALWLGAQFDLGGRLYDALGSVLLLPVPLEATGAFVLPAWQLLWVVGLWLGASHQDERSPLSRLPAGLVKTAIGMALAFFAWRYLVGQTPLPDWPAANHLFDKWQLGPLRLLNVAVLTICLAHFGPLLSRPLPASHYLATLGAASLPVFCAHLVLALAALALLGADDAQPLWLDLAVLAASLAALHRIARFSLERRSALPGDGRAA